MKKKGKCSSCGTHTGLQYCEACVDDWEISLNKAKRRLSNRNYTIALMILLALVAWTYFGLISGVPSVDSNAFCLNKLTQNFPEMNFIRAEYTYKVDSSSHLCKGYHQSDTALARDGLRQTEDDKLMTFTLVDSADIEYLQAGDAKQTGYVLLVILGSIFASIILLWMEVI